MKTILITLALFITQFTFGQDNTEKAKSYFLNYLDSQSQIEMATNALPTLEDCNYVFKTEEYASMYFNYSQELKQKSYAEIQKSKLKMNKVFVDCAIQVFPSNAFINEKQSLARQKLSSVLKNNITFYRVRYLKKKSDKTGTRFDHFININGRWVFFHKFWKAFKPLLNNTLEKEQTNIASKTDATKNPKANKAIKKLIGTWYLQQYQGSSVLQKKKPKYWAKKYKIDKDYNVSVSYIKLKEGYYKEYIPEANGKLSYYNDEVYIDFKHVTYFISKSNILKADNIPINPFYKSWYLIGDWKATNQTKSASYLIDFLTLNISKDYKVTFRQAMFESPMSFHFNGQIIKDMIVYKTKTYSHFEEGTKFLGTETDRFKINSVKENFLSITNLKNNTTIEYIRQ